MTKIAVTTPSLIQGISQQPSALRFSSQASVQENAFSSTVEGLQKRHPVELGARAAVGGVGQPLAHFINRDETERYAVLFGHNSVRVFEFDGTEVPVKGPTGPSYTPDFSSYLDLSKPVTVVDGEDYNGGNWTLSPGAETASNSAVVGPLGVGVGRILGSAVGSSAGTYTHTAIAFGSKPVTVSLYVRKSTASTITLNQRDTTNGVDHGVLCTWVGTTLTVTSTSGGASAKVSRVVAGWWRIALTFQVGNFGGGATTAVDGMSIVVGTTDFNASATRLFLAWGLRSDVGTEAGDHFLRGNRVFRALTVADYTFLLNTSKTTAMAGTTSPTDPSLRSAFLFVTRGNYSTTYTVRLQRSGDSLRTVALTTWDGTTSSIKNVWTLTPTSTGIVGTVWTVTILGGVATFTVATAGDLGALRTGLNAAINALPNVSSLISGSAIVITGDFDGQTITPSVTSGGAGSHTLTETTPVSGPGLNSVKSDDIAAELASRIGAFAGYTASSSGSVVKITTSSDLTTCETADSAGDSTLRAIWKTTSSVQDLPLVCQDGFVVKIVGETTDTGDDYYSKFIADTTGAFGRGHWEESLGHGLATNLNATTMPWQLTRKQDDGSGTVTGTANAKYFEWAPATWDARLVGDDVTAPRPSFVGQKLNDIFFYKNRLGFLAGQNCVLSEAGRYFNFWRTTVQQLVDSDLIDIAVPHTSVVNLRHAVPASETNFLFTSSTPFRIFGDPILTPKTVQTASVLEHENIATCHPVVSEKGVYFAFQRGDYAGIHELLPSTTVNDKFNADDLTDSIPKYIPGPALALAASQLEDVLFVLSENDRGALYVYKHFSQGDQKLQSSWSRYTFGNVVILGMAWIASDFYMLVQHNDGVWIERSRVSSGQVDEGAQFTTHLDRRFRAGADTGNFGTYDEATDTTSWTMAFVPDPGDVIQIVSRGAAPGSVFTARLSSNDTVVSASGDLSAVPVWIGKSYTMTYEFSEVTLKQEAGQGKVALSEGTLDLMTGNLIYASSLYFRVEVIIPGRDVFSSEFTGSGLGTPDEALGEATPTSGVFRFGVHAPARGTRIRIVNDSPLPCNLESVDWEANLTTKSRRYPS